MKLELNTSKLKAALICSSKKDVRYYLCGVLVEVKNGKLYLVGTDGHMLGAYCMGDVNFPDYQAIISNDDVKTILKLAGKRGIVTFDTEASIVDNLKITVVDGRFPDWRRVIPRSGSDLAHTNEFLHVDADIQAKALDSMRTAYGLKNKFPITTNAKGRFCYWVDSSGVVVVMPLRMDSQSFAGLLG